MMLLSPSRTYGPHASNRSFVPAYANVALNRRIRLGLSNHQQPVARSRTRLLPWGVSSKSSRRTPAAVATHEQQQLEDDEDWNEEDEQAGPAFKDTLQMLEWRRLCEHLSKHASTALGKRMCQHLSVPVAMQTSVRLLQETR
jgi:hypothetical protein